MKRINDLVFTSVQDTKSTLECTLIHDPKQALEDAEAVPWRHSDITNRAAARC